MGRQVLLIFLFLNLLLGSLRVGIEGGIEKMERRIKNKEILQM